MPEVEIYHSYSPVTDPSDLKKKKKKIDLSEILARLSKYLLVTGIIVLIISFTPSVWYQIKSGGIEKISKLISETIKGKAEEIPSVKNIEYQPRYDPKLPLESRIKIASARIDTQIWEATMGNYEDALKKGIWRVPDFGSPADRKRPTILAAHRFGYLAWSIPYRLRNSFYSLPKLKEGDVVEIVWRQRKYTYEIYNESKGEEIDDYSADLILYTCESLSSPVRIFKYGRLLQI
ncbi:sortase domain-bontaining protein [Patescibacteria group bacterium]